MFKSSRWRSDRNKFRVVFKLQFRAAQVPIAGDEALVVSVVPADSGKPTSKSEKAKVREGSCFWENPLFETVKFTREPKSGRVHEKIYHFIVGNGSTSKAGIVGEASIDFSNFVDSTKVTLVSLPLKNSKMQATLHVSVQRINESGEQREIEEIESPTLTYKDNSLMSQLSNEDIEETVNRISVDGVSFNQTVSHSTELHKKRRVSSGSDITLSSSDSASGNELTWQRNGNISNHGLKSDTQTTIYEEHERSSNWHWLGDSTLDVSTDDSSTEAYLRQNLRESSEISLEKLKSELSILSRRAEMSEVELQTLRKQIVKESKRGQDLYREVVCLKEEREALKSECEKLRGVSKGSGGSMKTENCAHIEGKDCWAVVEEVREELAHEKEMSTNLRIQLQKTQESNSELILAVKDLDEKLKKRSGSTPNHSNGELIEQSSIGQVEDDTDDDEEQKALEELVKEHTEAKEAYVLEREIMDMRSEIEMYKRDKDELEMQMEQLALDYEIMKQENHNMSHKLKQSEIQEQLKMQYECSSSYATVRELEVQIENLEKESSAKVLELEIQVKGLENEAKLRSKESAEASASIRELEAEVKNLEEELQKKSHDFEADLESLTVSKIEQEQRAIKAEKALRQTRWQNANTAEKLQGELKRLSVQMLSTFEANEKMASKSLSEANELRAQKNHLEEIIRTSTKETELMKGRYGARLSHVSGKVRSMTNQIEKLRLEVKNREREIEEQRKHAEETERLLSNEILTLRREIEARDCTNDDLTKEWEKLRASMKEMELALKRGNDERIELEKEIILAKGESDESFKELSEMKCLLEDKEITLVNLQTDLETFKEEYIELKRSMSEDELVKETLTKEVTILKTDLREKEDTINEMEKKIKDHLKASLKTSKVHSHGSKEVTNLKEKIKLLENEKDTEVASENNHKNDDFGALPVTSDDLSDGLLSDHDKRDLDELMHEMWLLRKRNISMEDELKEMQERYSEISLRFAEVEGERQQLVMKLRGSLKNAK